MISAYMPQTIIVTGGAGFIGSHLCRKLAEQGHRVISLDNYFTGSRENHVPGVEYREGHTKDIETLIPEKPDLVYHLGEYSRTEKSFEDIEIVWNLNKIGTFAVLEFMRRRGGKLIYAGSSTKFADDGLGRDQSPYAWTKATNSELVKNYSAWFGISYAITYFYNVYGPGERGDAFGTVIEIFRQNYLTGRPLGVTSPGTQTRNFTHVNDIVNGLILIGEKGEGDGFGLGDERAYSIQEVAKLFGGTIISLPARAGNRLTSSVDSSKSRALGWEARQHLAEYINTSIASSQPAASSGNRVLVFSATYDPIEGPAEQALRELTQNMPDLTFDIITTRYGKTTTPVEHPAPNVHVYRVGSGHRFDKFLLPLLGAKQAGILLNQHRYIFLWSIMASYGAASMLLTRRQNAPLLITLADQKLTWYVNLFLRWALRKTDQVYSSTNSQARHLASLKQRMNTKQTIGTGDAFVNQIRFAYTSFLKKL